MDREYDIKRCIKEQIVDTNTSFSIENIYEFRMKNGYRPTRGKIIVVDGLHFKIMDTLMDSDPFVDTKVEVKFIGHEIEPRKVSSTHPEYFAQMRNSEGILEELVDEYPQLALVEAFIINERDYVGSQSLDKGTFMKYKKSCRVILCANLNKLELPSETRMKVLSLFDIIVTEKAK